MKTVPLRDRLLQQEDLNFLLTNRIPRIALTRLMGWFSQIRSPLLARLSIAVWRLFTDLDLSDAKKQRFDSLHDCFTRELVPGARQVAMAADVLASRIHDFASWPQDPQVVATGVVAEAAPDGVTSVPWVRVPGALHPGAGDTRLDWPDIGEHSDVVLRDMLGMDHAEIARLRADGVLEPLREGGSQ